jgi:ferrochelatase
VSIKTGLLLINLGTPDGPTAADVRPFLRQFLLDPRVLDLPGFFRWCLVNIIIAPFRSPKSAKLYQTIWDSKRGLLPLLANGRSLEQALRELFRAAPTNSVAVELAMRYGNPSIRSALNKFAECGIDDIVIFPLFPQYSSAAFGSAVAEIYEIAAEAWNVPRLSVVKPYYDHPDYIHAITDIARPVVTGERIDHWVFSYHGIPVRHCQKSLSDGTSVCGTATCCDKLTEINQNCYRAQCVDTSRRIAKSLGLKSGEWTTVFQSRFGRDQWIGPTLAQTVIDLATSGVKRLGVLTPSFTADCLETIEEIGVGIRESFLHHGGERLTLVPCLNAHPVWVEVMSKIAKNYLQAMAQ